jgi:hypothetical protein
MFILSFMYSGGYINQYESKLNLPYIFDIDPDFKCHLNPFSRFREKKVVTMRQIQPSHVFTSCASCKVHQKTWTISLYILYSYNLAAI